jgi:cysteine desulfurase
VGKLPVDIHEPTVDLLTFASHKLHGPKGAGALYVRRGVRLIAQQIGGPQEKELRGGTENVPAIVGFGVAAEKALAYVNDQSAVERVTNLRNKLEATLVQRCGDTVINSVGAPRLHNTSNIGFRSLEAEAILLGLSERGVFASAGAACSSGSLEPSPILLAMGIEEPIANGSIRFSLSRLTTEAEIEHAIEVTQQVVSRLNQVLPIGTR